MSGLKLIENCHQKRSTLFTYSRIVVLTSSTIDKKLEIELEIHKNLEYELEIDKNLENFESNFEFFVNFEFIFEFFVNGR